MQVRVEVDPIERGLRSALRAEDRPGHDRRYAMDSGLIRALGWEPETRFAEGLKRTVRWYASNRSWWRKVRTRSL
jgi:dTDP-glucose 4,6-dehydratase